MASPGLDTAHAQMEAMIAGLRRPERPEREAPDGSVHTDESDECLAATAWQAVNVPLRDESGDEPGAGSGGPTALESGARVGRYVVLRQLGAGGMGVVHAAYDPELDRRVALKLVASGMANEEGRRRLLREAQALAKLSHRNVVAIHDVGTAGEQVWLAMELVQGRTLSEWSSERRRSWDEILEVFIAAGRGLQAMHELGLVHRDFKPSNVLVDEHDRPRLIDFGLVSGLQRVETDALRSIEGTTLAPDERLTQQGMLLGTPRYMSPEQFRGLEVSAASDQFSFCVCLFEALYGRAPFGGTDLHALMTSVLDGRLEAPPTSDDVPAEIWAILLRGLQRDADARWPGMESLLGALGTLLTSYYDPRARRDHRRIGIGLASLAMTILACGLLLVASGSIELSAANAVTTDCIVLVTTGGFTLALRSRWQSQARVRRFIGFYFLVMTIYSVQDFLGYLTDRPLYHSVLGNSAFLTVLCFFAAPLMGPALRLCGVWSGLCTMLIVVDASRYFSYFTAGNLGGALLVNLLLPRTQAMSSAWRSTRDPESGRRSRLVTGPGCSGEQPRRRAWACWGPARRRGNGCGLAWRR